VAIITGGASGIGRALGEALASRGATVVLADRDSALAEQAAAAVVARGGAAEALHLDVTVPEDVRALIALAASRHGRLDYLFNSAGVAIGGEAVQLDDHAWSRVLEVDLLGVVHCVRAGYPIMVAQGFGHIVNIASVAGLVPVPFQAPYVAAKFGVVGLSLALRSEARDLGVRVSVVCPGLIETPILETTPILGADRGRVLRLLPKAMAASACAERILCGVEKNQGIIVVTSLARAMWLGFRVSPALVDHGALLAMRRLRAACSGGDRARSRRLEDRRP